MHQGCYDIDKVPEGEWFCDVCAQRRRSGAAGASASANGDEEAAAPLPACALCELDCGGGAGDDAMPAQPMVPCDPTSGGGSKYAGRFVHYLCALALLPRDGFRNDQEGRPRVAYWDAVR